MANTSITQAQRVAHQCTLANSPPSPASPLELLAGADGIFVTGHNVGDAVDAGETIGTIVDPFGTVQSKCELREPVSCGP